MKYLIKFHFTYRESEVFNVKYEASSLIALDTMLEAFNHNGYHAWADVQYWEDSP